MAFNLLRTSARSLLSPSVLSLARPVPSLLVARSLRALSTEARSKIDGAITKHPVVLFMKGTPDLPQCGFSRAVCQILEVQGVDGFASFNCLEDPELREGIKEFSSWPTIPQLYVKGEFIGGCDIVLAMHQNGELEKLFIDAGVVEPISALPDAGSAPPS